MFQRLHPYASAVIGFALPALIQPASAASVFMDEAGLSWLTPSVWGNDAAPSASNDYFLRANVGATSVRGTMLTSPAGTTSNGSANFTGSSLEASELTTLVVKQRGTETLAIRNGNGDLKLSGGTIRFDPNQGGSTPVFDVDRLTFDGGRHFIEVSSSSTRITFDGILSGTGRLRLLAKRNSFPAGNVVTFTEVNNTALTGTISVSDGIVLDFGSDVSPAGSIELEDSAQLRVDQVIRLGSGRLTDPVNGTVPDGTYLGTSLAALGANYVDGGGALVVGTGGALPVFTVTTLADELDTPVETGAGLSLREALGLAVLGRIHFDPALDGGTIQLDAARGPLAVRTSVTIDASALPAGLTIDGGSNGDDVQDAGETRCLLIDDENADNLLEVVLRGLTLQNGVASGDDAGGNIHNHEHLTLENCRLLDGRAVGSGANGGGIFSAPGSRLILTGCTLSGNRAASTTSSGGAVYFETEANFNSATLVFAMSASTVSDNFTGGHGGGLFVGTFGLDNGGLATIATSTISGNTATSAAGGISTNGITLRMSATTVANNTVTATSGSGGGIVFLGNAIFSNSLKPLIMTNCTVVGNTAGRDGGGLFHAGPIAASLQRSRFTSCTIAGNRTTVRDGGGFLNANGSQLDLVNSIVAGNTAAGAGPDIDGGFTSGGVNFIGTTSGSSGFRNGTDRSFANTGSSLATLLATTAGGSGSPLPLLAGNGGPTPTVALLPNSPAIDAGLDGALPAGLENDQRGAGFPRIRDGRVDIGAVEANFPVVMDAANNSWLTPAVWDNDQVPSPANDYLLAPVGNTIMRTSPQGTIDGGTADFTGRSLTVPGGTSLLVKQQDGETASIRAGAGDLILDGGSLLFGPNANNRPNSVTFDVNDFVVTAAPGASIANSPAMGRATIDARLTGPGDLLIEIDGDRTLAGRPVAFTAVDEDGYTGTITVAKSLVLDFDTDVLFRGGAGVTLLGASQLRVDQLLAFRVGRLVDPVNGPVPPGIYFPGHVSALGPNYLDAGGTLVVSNALGDTDADGLPDYFEQFIIDFDPADAVFGFEGVAGLLAATATDFDNDGVSDAAEFKAGTDPTDAASFPPGIRLERIEPTVVGGVVTRVDITFRNLDPSTTYQLRRGLNLEVFDVVVDTQSPGETVATFSDTSPPAGGRAFYRLEESE
ncbi:choice-of-anchor Q domain-containing protein [Luteolibacter marinus]|uniref:choice-of-anchor Q domain-containing protein n=1 Tax=Luteolibacter marinus TaxID=2776705 RepID=UPI001868FBD3|nr:choice-of-anchor Q domain-containing protein [Luteolibacter marinus]